MPPLNLYCPKGKTLPMATNINEAYLITYWMAMEILG